MLACLEHADRASDPIELRDAELAAIDHRRRHCCVVLVIADRGTDRREHAIPDILFGNEEGVEAAWDIVDPVLDGVTPIAIYEPHTWGPADADRLALDVGGWILPTPTD